MGTIGDLLGIDLAATLAQDPDQADTTSSQPDSPASSSDTPFAAGEPGSHAALGQDIDSRHEAVLAAVLAETDLDPAQARADLTLTGDLDLDTLSLYAIVTSVERELRCSFADETVASWQTLGDILSAVDAIGKAR